MSKDRGLNARLYGHLLQMLISLSFHYFLVQGARNRKVALATQQLFK